jgi:hypothetical protein
MQIVRRPLIIARHSNVVKVDFSREPDPPAPRFPGAGAVRIVDGDFDDDRLSPGARGACLEALARPILSDDRHAVSSG